MTVSERERVVNLLTEKRDRLLQAVEGLTAEQMEFRAGPDRWSVVDCVEHTLVVERRVLAGIERALKGPGCTGSKHAARGAGGSAADAALAGQRGAGP